MRWFILNGGGWFVGALIMVFLTIWLFNYGSAACLISGIAIYTFTHCGIITRRDSKKRGLI